MASRIYGHVIDQSGNLLGRVRDLRGTAGAVELRIDAGKVAQVGELIGKIAGMFPQAVARALTRTAEETKTAVGRALVMQTGLPAREVGKALRATPASVGSLSAAIVARGSYVPLGRFQARQTKRGVSATPWAKRRIFGGTFVIPSYGNNVYKRVGKARFPLHKLYGPAIPKELPKDQSAAAFWSTVPPVLAKRLDHEMGRLLA